MNSYIDWMKCCYLITILENPSISVPCGYTPEGLPVGLQIVGRRFDDLGVLQASAAYEQLAPWADKRPQLG
jgi:Asp-tRNA(Asn)/Glu-tRNA(Gln) amidotransferase A subunit family amidase